MNYLVIFVCVLVLGQTFGYPKGAPVLDMESGPDESVGNVTTTSSTTLPAISRSAFMASECASGLTRFNGICIDVVTPTPCSPSTCGPHSQCREVNSKAICSCKIDFIGTPPNCQPECTINSECASDKACLNHKCVDPCVNQCAKNANCRVIAHNPFCSCKDRFTGDPFTNCIPLSIPKQRPEVNLCIPCAPNSQCQEFNDNARCIGLPNDSRSPPRSRPECTTNYECNALMACINNRCSNPCPGPCGINALCEVNNHLPLCSCGLSFIGDPFSSCRMKDSAVAFEAGCLSGFVRFNEECVKIDDDHNNN